MNLPDIAPSQATLPRTYEAAKQALAECQSVDECGEWRDKAAALASYAKQSQDETLLKMAARIKARATRRAGELINQIEPVNAARDRRDGGGLPLSRKDAAREAGFSERQQKTAQRTAAVPGAEFEAQVEGDNPPTLTQLAQQGIKPRPLVDHGDRDPREFNCALHFVGNFENYAKELEREDIDGAVACLTMPERTRLRGFIDQIDRLHDQIITRI